MTQQIVAIYGELLAAYAEIEAMKIKNIERLSNDQSPAYGEQHFWEKAEEIRGIAARIYR